MNDKFVYRISFDYEAIYNSDADGRWLLEKITSYIATKYKTFVDKFFIHEIIGPSNHNLYFLVLGSELSDLKDFCDPVIKIENYVSTYSEFKSLINIRNSIDVAMDMGNTDLAEYLIGVYKCISYCEYVPKRKSGGIIG